MSGKQPDTPSTRPAEANSAMTRREALGLPGGAAQGPGRPAPPDDLHFCSLREVAGLLETREISPLDVTRRLLERITALDGRLRAYATVTPDRALAAARRAEQEIASGQYRGPLHGVPIAVKDLCYTEGTRTMGGSAAYRDFVPDFDATVVRRLESAGAVLLGKLNLTEGAMAGYHPDFDIPFNPWGDSLWSGASSSGSGVAVAAGLCFAALGTDTGGSIRFPAMANGIVGLKPTYGRVSRYGVLPLAESLDHVGPMARRTADAAAVLQAIAGHDDNDPTSLREGLPDLLAGVGAGIGGLRIGYDGAFASAGTDAGLVAAIERALEQLQGLGAEIVEVRMPAEAAHTGDAWFAICAYEAHRAHAAKLQSNPDSFGPFFHDFLAVGASVTDEQYAGAQQFRTAFSQPFNAVLESVDAMVCPSGGVSFPVERSMLYGDREAIEPLFAAAQMQFTIPADFAGTPTLTVPCGLAESGAPYALQFMGRRLSEAKLCLLGHSYEHATGWHERHPAL